MSFIRPVADSGIAAGFPRSPMNAQPGYSGENPKDCREGKRGPSPSRIIIFVQSGCNAQISKKDYGS